MQSTQTQQPTRVTERIGREIEIALPEPGMSMEQDSEWCVVRVNGEWRRIRFHDYDRVYSVPGLYERLFYDILQCSSPAMLRGLLDAETRKADVGADELRVLDLGAGNGMVAEQLAEMGVESIVGTDIIPEAEKAARRDRPAVYDDYVVADMAELSQRETSWFETFEFNCLTCVAALGFGDIPPEAFANAFNLIADGGWVAFNIKESFLDGDDSSGFSRLIQSMIREEIMTVRSRRRYTHRVSTAGEPLYYVAIIGTKSAGIPESLLS